MSEKWSKTGPIDPDKAAAAEESMREAFNHPSSKGSSEDDYDIWDYLKDENVFGVAWDAYFG